MQTQLQFIWASSRRSHSRSVQPGGFAFPPQFYWDIVDIQQGLHSDLCPCAANFCHWGVLCTWMSKQNPVLTGTWPHAQPLNCLLFLSATHWTVYKMYCMLSCLIKEILQTRICCFLQCLKATIMNTLSFLEHGGSFGGCWGGSIRFLTDSLLVRGLHRFLGAAHPSSPGLTVRCSRGWTEGACVEARPASLYFRYSSVPHTGQRWPASISEITYMGPGFNQMLFCFPIMIFFWLTVETG